MLETYIRETTELVHLTINGELIKTTFEHPFYVKDVGFVNAGELMVGSELIDSTGEIIFVEDIMVEFAENPVTVYNLQVEDFHTYHVGDNGVLVHNANYQPQNPPNFKDVKDLDDFKSRVPKNATEKPFADIYPNGAKEGVKFEWTDAAGDKYTVRAHSVDPTAPAGSNASNGWVYRVGVKEGGMGSYHWMDGNGVFHLKNVFNPNSPFYDPAVINDTHIPFGGGQ